MRILLKILTINFLFFSCSNEKNDYSGIEGVWQRIGKVSFSNGKPADTLFYNNKLPSQKKMVEGKHFKTFSNEHFVWFRYTDFIDSLGVNIGKENVVQGKYEVKNDSLFETIMNVHDDTKERWAEWRKKNNSVYKAKILVAKESYIQYRVKEDGSGSGELWSKVDTFGEKSNSINGAFTINNRVIFENYKPKDTTIWRENDPDRIWFSIYTDNHRTTFFNQTRIDSLGNDTWKGSGLLMNYQIQKDSIFEEFVYGTKQPQKNFKGKSTRKNIIDLSNYENFIYGRFGKGREDGGGAGMLMSRLD